jgi:thiol:disulfide interchange protein
MWGLFTINLPTALYAVDPSKDTAGGSFIFGAFTAILATPCTAPLLPALMLWAASQPPAVAVALFTTVGIGMALPYLVMAAFPELARALPRTGPASEVIKQTLGFFVFGTAVFLVGQRLLEGNHWAWLVTGVALIAGVFVIYRTARLFSARPKPVSIAVAFAVLLVGSTAFAAAKLNEKTVAWQPYSDQALTDARANGRTVLVKFTANWCANCHVVEGTVFTDKAVQKALLDKDVLLLKVDLTFKDAPGSQLLRQLNPAGGIPLTAIYFPGRTEPVQLTSIYTSGALLAELK